jgi:AAA15 family ATPase/GTPase
MLVQFTTANFMSFKDEATFSLIASKRRSKNKSLDAGAVFDAFGEIKLLKSAVIYGANGSGKSSLIKALRFMKRFVIESSKESQADEKIGVEPFRLAPDSQEKPSKFEIIFVRMGFLYQYEFTADCSSIHQESLTRKSEKDSREELLFKRNGDKINIGPKFPEGKGLSGKTRKNALFLSVCANFDGAISTEVIRWFRTVKIISGLSDEGLFNFTTEKLSNPTWNAKIRSLLKDFDLGIERLEAGNGEHIQPDFGDVPAEFLPVVQALNKIKFEPPKKINSYHRSFDQDGNLAAEVAFDLRRDESEGTKKLVALSGPLIDVLEKSYVLVIDEFDARLHAVLTRSILSLFNRADLNQNHAQLVVATHDTNLLDKDLVRRDQVWFTERDYYGISHITSLVEYKVRNDASYEKDYVTGKYGAIPLVGDIKRIFGPHGDEPDLATSGVE